MQAIHALLAALKARLPGVHLRTLEEARAIVALRQAVQALSGQLVPRVLWRWSSASGLQRLSLDDEEPERPLQDPCGLDEALNAFRKTQENVVLALLDPWAELSNPIFVRALREALAHARGSGKALVLVGRDWRIPAELQSDLFIADLPLPTRGELCEYVQSLAVLYREQLAGKVTVDEATLPALARACQGLTLDETRNLVALSLVNHRALGPDAIRLAIREKRQIVRRTGVLEYEEPEHGMADIGGLENLKSWIAKRTSLFGDAARAAGILPPKGVLLVGVPGTGKTLAARAVAAAWRLPLVRLDAGRLFGSLVGESESNLRQAIRTAEAIAPCVVLVDEVEKAFGPGGGHDGGTAQRVFGALLTWLSDKKAECFVVATANEIGALPPELLRKGRFDEIFAVDLPGTEARAEILRIHLERAGQRFEPANLLDLAHACAGFTGAELEAAVQNALVEAFHDRMRKLDLQDVLKALRETVPLSKTMPEKIEALRDWCRSGRAVAAGLSLESDRSRQPVAVEV
ncbi:MAG: AAA family ATPase [Planctomycetes bacterium]|nr:AAA family ATPase [Planctomycetota bacterium]